MTNILPLLRQAKFLILNEIHSPVGDRKPLPDKIFRQPGGAVKVVAVVASCIKLYLVSRGVT
jgi:hypothetical protein